jgi:L-cystine transport system substrate-binding protein
MTKLGKIIVLLGTVAMVTMFTSCNRKADSGAVKVTEVIIGTGADFPPLSFYNDKNELSGFEIDTLRAIDESLPQYAFTYKTFDFQNVLLSLETGKIDIGAHLFEYNTERAKKFLYGETGYFKFDLYWVVREDNDDFHSIEDLAGKTYVSESTASNNFYIVNKWNDEHGKPFNIIFESSFPLLVDDIENGTATATLATLSQINGWKDNYHAKIKMAGGVYNESDAYFLFNKETGEQFKTEFDNALSELKRNGVLKEIAIKYWGHADYLAK